MASRLRGTNVVPSLVRFAIGAAVLSTALASTATCSMRDKGENSKTIEAAMARHGDKLMSLPGVVGVGIGECEGAPCIKVFVARKSAELSKKIPSELEGFPVDVVETGKFRALASQ